MLNFVAIRKCINNTPGTSVQMLDFNSNKDEEFQQLYL